MASASEQIRELYRQGLSEKEVESRTGLTHKQLAGAMHGKTPLSEEQSAEVERRLRERAGEDADTARVLGPDGHMVTVETTNRTGEKLLREYMEAVDAYHRGDDPGGAGLRRFAGKSITVLTPEGRKQFPLVTDPGEIKAAAKRTGEKQTHFGGEEGS